MLNVRVNGQSLDLGKISISFELLSPIFNEIGSFSYPFTFPATANNKAILGFHNRINNNLASPQKSACEILLKGISWKRGNLVITETNDVYFKAHFTVGEGYFYSTIKDLKLADLDLGGERAYLDYYNEYGPWGQTYEKSYPEADFAIFPFQMPNFYEDSMKGENLINNFDGKVNYFSSLYRYGIAHNTFVLFPFLNFVLKSLFSQLGFAYSKNAFYDNEYLRQLTLFNNITERQWHPDDIIYSGMLLNFNLSSYVPDLTISEFIDFLRKYFNSHFIFDDFKNEVSIHLFKDILNSQPILLEVPRKFNYVKPNDYDGFKMEYSFDPDDDSTKEYFKDISKFNFKGNIESALSLPLFPQNKDVYFVENIHRYYYAYRRPAWLFGDPDFIEWKDFCSDLPVFFEGNKKLELEIPGVFSRNINEATCANAGKWQIIDTPYELSERPQPRLIFWHGLIAGIPYGSPFNGSPGVNGPIISPYSLEWEGQHGLKEKFHTEYLEFMKTTREAEIDMILKPAELKDIDFSRKYRFAEANWLLSSIKFTVTNDKISPATVVAFKS